MHDSARGSDAADKLSAETRLRQAIVTRRTTVGIIGLGYVGIPLALATARAGLPVLGFDINEARVAQINRGESFIRPIAADAIGAAIRDHRFQATAHFMGATYADVADLARDVCFAAAPALAEGNRCFVAWYRDHCGR